MRYLMLNTAARAELLASLAAMPGFLERSFAGLSADEARRPGPGEALSPVEQCWHLADLEREGYAVRIERLRREVEPALPDFDGARIARERSYRTRDLREAIAAFREARVRNLEAFASLDSTAWSQRGRQEGVGAIMLCDVPAMMAEHDASHRGEIADWQRARG